jgi:hypothetical protein
MKITTEFDNENLVFTLQLSDQTAEKLQIRARYHAPSGVTQDKDFNFFSLLQANMDLTGYTDNYSLIILEFTAQALLGRNLGSVEAVKHWVTGHAEAVAAWLMGDKH